MHTLERLQRGDLAGITRLDLGAGLTELPQEVFGLADSLEILNLSSNRLRRLPAELPRLRKLRILFCSDNDFEQLPEVLGDCPQLEMVGFKANRIAEVPAAALPPALRWLILTDNRIERLPAALGERPRLQKLMLAGNRLTELPQSLADCARLELLRIAANRLPGLPSWLLRLPRLSWLAFAGNPFSDAEEARVLAAHPLPPIPHAQVRLGEVLGQGASGIIQRAEWQAPGSPPKAMAAKLFKGAVTSDGLPHSEMAACIAAGRHPHLIGVAGPLASQENTPPGLLMELIDRRYSPLGEPPSLASCTRDCYPAGQRFSLEQALNIARGAAAVTAHLHRLGILHGDLYAHNLQVDVRGHCLLGDFGAASFFRPDSADGLALQRLESRAFGCLLEELLTRVADPQPVPEAALRLGEACLTEQPECRPLLAEIARTLEAL